MSYKLFGELVREKREHLELSLRGLAKELGIDYRMLSKIERDERPGPAPLRQRLLQRLGVDPREVNPCKFKFDRTHARTFLRLPTFRPKGDRSSSVRVGAAMKTYPLMRTLLNKAPAWSRDFLRRLRIDSALEALFLAHCLAAGAKPTRVRPVMVGFDLQWVIDPSDKLKRYVGHSLVPAFELGKALFIPQTALLGTDGEVYVCDALVRYKEHWFDLEIDGAGHESQRDQAQKLALKPTAMRFTEADLLQTDFIQLCFKQIQQSNAR